MTRSWGWWTRHKLEILEEYLQAFVTATKHRSTERIYLDLFAGSVDNRDRITDAEILGSVHRALGVHPPFTRVAVFELEVKARQLEEALRRNYPNRNEIRVYPGDCNVTVARALADLRSVAWAPSFAFVDQNAVEVHWSTLEQLAQFRRHPYTKAEIWLLVGTSFLLRGLGVRQEFMNAEFGDRLTDMYGTEEWFDTIKALRADVLSSAEARLELVNLMRWRLERVLGYKETHAFTMRKTNGADLYDMIFASDHPVGDKIMRQLYGKALGRNEQMRREAQVILADKRRQKAGQDSLFGVEEVPVPLPALDQVYQPEPSHEPYRLP